MRLVRDSGRVLNGAPQFVGRPKGELQWRQMSAGGVAEEQVGISVCQVLWKIVGTRLRLLGVKCIFIIYLFSTIPFL